VRDAARDDGDAAGGELAPCAIDVQRDLAFKHVEGLVRIGVNVQRRHLAQVEGVLEQQVRTTGLGRGGLPGV